MTVKLFPNFGMGLVDVARHDFRSLKCTLDLLAALLAIVASSLRRIGPYLLGSPALRASDKFWKFLRPDLV